MPEPSKKNPLGPTGVIASRRVQELRNARGWTYKELSDRLEAAGRPIPPLGLRRIESRDRRIDADDLVALAITFGVNPSALLLPMQGHGDVEITGEGKVPAARAWAWADGKRPLEDDEDGQLGVDFQVLGRPPGQRKINAGTRAGREYLAQQWQDIEGAVVERDGAGEIVRMVHPAGYELYPGARSQESEGGDDDAG